MVLGHKLKHPLCGQTAAHNPPLTLQFELPLEPKCGYVFVFLSLGVTEEGRGRSGRRNEFPPQLRCSPLTDKHTSHTCIVFHFQIGLTVFRFFSINYYDPFKINLCFIRFERLPLKQERMTFNMAASSPAALREHIDSKPSGLTQPEDFLFLQAKLGSQKWHEGLYYCPIFPTIMPLLCPLKSENDLTVR